MLVEGNKAEGHTSTTHLQGSDSQPRAQASEVWRTPSRLCIKINIDAAVRESNEMMGIGIVIRDHEGQFFYGRESIEQIRLQGSSEGGNC